MSKPAYDTEFCTVEFDPRTGIVHLCWKKFAKDKPFREALEAGLTEVKARSAKGWIGDVRGLGVVDPGDQDWVNTDWFPRLLGAGVVRMAVILGAKAITRMSVGRIMEKVEGTNFVSRYVADFDEGRVWLLSELAPVRKSA